MHNGFTNQNSNPIYPYYGQPYHTYIPPGYPQQAPRPNFPSAQAPYNSPASHSAVDPWTREKLAFPQPHPMTGLPPARPSPSGRDTPFIPPNPDAPINAGHAPKPRLKRSSTTRPKPMSEKPPLRSAMKKNGMKRSDSVSAVPLERTRTSSSARQRLTPMTRSRTNSNPSYLPDHMFVSFYGTNELRLGNVAFQDTLDEIKEHIMPMWPHGVSSQMPSSHSWRVSFSRNPWSATGSDAIIVQRMISELFTCLCRRGYQYLTSLNTGYSYPQLVFRDVASDEDSDFFVAYLSRSGHKLTLVRPPRRVGEQLGPRLRSAWPYKIAASSASEEEIYSVELKRNAFGAPELDKDIFASHALQEINVLGYKLEATVPLPRPGLLSFGGKKELWVFRGTRIRPRSESRSASGRA
ncbi:hypothetical protein HYDPIDRAFT_82441 [Hydnomerulius pinastri MD-312]|nr:hypothetical protein HYDPIDRAFT_82441 [Hydnomerulius pinastri MD-312]